MFNKVLIANRGEIAVRVMRTCDALGVSTVAVHATDDKDSLHVRAAGESVDLGEGAATDTYLNAAAIVEAAKATGAEAIHPGYGFLAENADFATSVVDAGLSFIGPSADAIRTMGEKVAARAVARAAGVPLAPGSDGAMESSTAVREFGEEHGYPLLIKASFGGGGRGMRRVDSAGEADEAFDAAVREATAAFGNGEVYVERYLVNSRHVEVQVLADRLGHTIYVGDRDCSVQRRHQKLIEEAPAPHLSDELHQALGEAAVRLAQEVGYENACTVEFLVEDDQFYFLEMNTRIQVEHPVTEAVSGLDIVAEQLRVASGESLSVTQSRHTARGCAVEARINAEDVTGGLFLPSPGVISELIAPSFEGARWDAGYESGDEILPSYDSLIGKLIAWGPDRDHAIERLDRALHALRIEGVHTTIPAAVAVLRHNDFRAVRHTTRWLTDTVDLDALGQEEQLRQDVEIGGRYYRVPVFADGPVAAAGAAVVSATMEDSGHRTARKGSQGTRRRSAAKAHDGTVTAPMQGTIVKVNVADGTHVSKGDQLFVLEAMKMENPILAPVTGVISNLSVAVGDSQSAGSVLAHLTEDDVA